MAATGKEAVTLEQLKMLEQQLGAGGKIGAVDVLFRSETGAASGTLSHPVEDYDVVCVIATDSISAWYMACSSPSGWNKSSKYSGNYAYLLEAPRVDSGMFDHTLGQMCSTIDLNIVGTNMRRLGLIGAQLNVHLVIGIKTVGEGFS